MSSLGNFAFLTQWLKTSGIQETKGADAGGVYAWLDVSNGKKPYIYSETTGYFISLACHLARTSGDISWIDRARMAGDWLIKVAIQDNGAVLLRKYPSSNRSTSDRFSFNNQLTVFFDCAIVGYGLINLYKKTADKSYLDGAVMIADFCLSNFVSLKNGSFKPVYDLKINRAHPECDHWSLHWGSFNLKGSLFLTELHELTHDNNYSNVVDLILPAALASQKQNGRFGTSQSLAFTHLHPHNYTIEALLYLSKMLGRSDLLDRAKAAIDFSFTHCLCPENGLTHAWPETDSYCIAEMRSDVLAQSLRCYYIAKLLDPTCAWEWESCIPELLDTMDRYTLPDGGTSYGTIRGDQLLPHANAWCHFFRIEMLIYRHYYQINKPIEEREFIIT